jgi:hypothetical protein
MVGLEIPAALEVSVSFSNYLRRLVQVMVNPVHAAGLLLSCPHIDILRQADPRRADIPCETAVYMQNTDVARRRRIAICR